jgi:hypothetical protein
MLQKIKCWIGWHELVDLDNISIGRLVVDGYEHWRPARSCKYCHRGGDCL